MSIILDGTNGITTQGATPTINSGSSTLSLQTNSTTAVTIDTSQNVGIGTSSPTSKLCVGTAISGSEANALIQVNMATPTVAGGTGMLAIGSTDSVAVDKGGVLSFHGNTTSLSGNSLAFVAGKSEATGAGVYSGYLQFATSNSGGTVAERMRIDSSGYLLVGISSWATLTGAGSGITGTAALGGYIVTRNAGTSSVTCMSFRNDNNQVGSIYTNGTTTTYLTSSDYRLKENIVPMTGALETVSKLKPVKYNWKWNGSEGQGFIAHELQEIFPEAVGGEKDAVNEDGSINPQGVDTSYLVATLTAAIQELKAIVDAQQQEINALKNK